MKSEASSYTGVYLYSLSEKETCPLSHEVRASIVHNKSPLFASNSTDLGVKTSSRSNPIVVWFLLNKPWTAIIYSIIRAIDGWEIAPQLSRKPGIY